MSNECLLDQYGTYICNLLSNETKYRVLKDFQKDTDLMDAMLDYDCDPKNHYINDFINYHIKEVFINIVNCIVHDVLKKTGLTDKGDYESDQEITDFLLDKNIDGIDPPFNFIF
jgi:hypothetical protein